MDQKRQLIATAGLGHALAARIERPTIVVDPVRAKSNLSRLAKKAAKGKTNLRPHVKTHQSAHLAEWLKPLGVKSITCSSLDMAAYFADAGWTDITVAFVANLREMNKINRLAELIDLGLVIDSMETLSGLKEGLNFPVSIWLKIDEGHHRTGLPYDELNAVIDLAKAVVQDDRLNLAGILTHAGHTYKASSQKEVRKVFSESVRRMNEVRKGLETAGFNGLMLSVGDTPGVSLAENLGQVDEIRPGNMIFYDLMQLELGACSADDLAAAVACPVVGIYPRRSEIAIYGGAVHFSKDCLPAPDGGLLYGRPAKIRPKNLGQPRPRAWVKTLTQEHGLIQADQELMETMKVGDLLLILPVHICLTANLLGSFLTLDGRKIPMARFY